MNLRAYIRVSNEISCPFGDERMARVWLTKQCGLTPILYSFLYQPPKSDTSVMLKAHLKEVATLKRVIDGKCPGLRAM